MHHQRVKVAGLIRTVRRFITDVYKRQDLLRVDAVVGMGRYTNDSNGLEPVSYTHLGGT